MASNRASLCVTSFSLFYFCSFVCFDRKAFYEFKREIKSPVQGQQSVHGTKRGSPPRRAVCGIKENQLSRSGIPARCRLAIVVGYTENRTLVASTRVKAIAWAGLPVIGNRVIPIKLNPDIHNGNTPYSAPVSSTAHADGRPEDTTTRSTIPQTTHPSYHTSVGSDAVPAESSNPPAILPQPPVRAPEGRPIPDLVGGTVIVEGQSFVPGEAGHQSSAQREEDLKMLDLEELCFMGP